VIGIHNYILEALRIEELSPAEVCIILVLAQRRQTTTILQYEGKNGIVLASAMSPKSVRKHVASLVDKGYVILTSSVEGSKIILSFELVEGLIDNYLLSSPTSTTTSSPTTIRNSEERIIVDHEFISSVEQERSLSRLDFSLLSYNSFTVTIGSADEWMYKNNDWLTEEELEKGYDIIVKLWERRDKANITQALAEFGEE
jgi:hypothetical protein